MSSDKCMAHFVLECMVQQNCHLFFKLKKMFTILVSTPRKKKVLRIVHTLPEVVLTRFGFRRKK